MNGMTNAGVSTGWKRWRPGKKTLFAVLAVVVVLFLFRFFTGGQTETNPTLTAPVTGPKEVKVADVKRQSIGAPPEFVAEVVPYSTVDVVVEANGKVEELRKRQGDTVEQGEVLFVIESENAQWAAEKARLSLESAQAQQTSTILELQGAVLKLEQQTKDALENWNRLRNQYDMGLATEEQVEQAEELHRTLQADLEATREKLQAAQMGTQVNLAEITLQEAEKNLDNHFVKAPISGVLTDYQVEKGMMMSPGVRAGKIQQLDPIKIKAELTAAARQQIRPGVQELEFYIPGVVEKQKGKIAYLADVMNAASKSYTLELEVPNPGWKLKPGMRAQILLRSEADQQVVAIPTTSVVREGEETYVFVYHNGKVEKRKVELGRLNGTLLEVISGVKEGEKLVVSGQYLLKDGEQVKLAQ